MWSGLMCCKSPKCSLWLDLIVSFGLSLSLSLLIFLSSFTTAHSRPLLFAVWGISWKFTGKQSLIRHTRAHRQLQAHLSIRKCPLLLWSNCWFSVAVPRAPWSSCDEGHFKGFSGIAMCHLLFSIQHRASGHDGSWVSFNERFPAWSLPGQLLRNITQSLRAHSFKLRLREKLQCRKQNIFKGTELSSRKVTGAVFDFRPRHGSARVGLVKPTGPCLPLSFPQFRPKMRWSTWWGKCVCICVCVFLQRQKGKVRLWLWSKTGKRWSKLSRHLPDFWIKQWPNYA